MKKLFILSMIVAGSLIANSAYSQVRVEGQFGITERDFPGYSYYDYPAWRGHYFDRAYYEHYRHRFYRQHRRYFRGREFFDHERWNGRYDGDRGRYDRERDRHDHRW